MIATASVPHRSSCIKTWKGDAGNVDAAQKQLLARAQANGEASKGEYVPIADARADIHDRVEHRVAELGEA